MEIGSLKFQRVIIINATKTRYLTAKWSRTKMRRNIRQLVIIPAAWYGARTSSHAEIGTVCIFFSHCIVAGLYSLLISIGATTLWGPWDDGDHMDQVYNVPCNSCKWLSFFRWTLREASDAYADLAECNGRRKDE